jgi:UDP-galactopyranose mutase
MNRKKLIGIQGENVYNEKRVLHKRKEQKMYDCIVIGAGIAGTVAARILAEDAHKKVLVVERRSHIGGNCYDEKDAHGILIHNYGPHIFHTGLEEVYAYLSRFTDWYAFGHEVVAKVGDQLIPVPFNLNTLHMVYDKEKADRLEQKLIAAYGEGSRVPIMKLRENEDSDIREIAQYVYENVFLKYTMKQWGQKPEEISPEVTGRVPVLISYDNRYFQDKYQGVPKDGFTPMFEKMLDHENITVRLNTPCTDVLQFKENMIYFEGKPFAGEVIYTGALDELFDCRFGRLPYRSLDFHFEYLNQDSYQGHSVVNYTVSEDYTRITEFKYLTGQRDAKGTTIVKEYPFAYTGAEGEIPYYAILNDENQALYEKYKALTDGMDNFHLLGRLAEYKYYNIDAMTKKAMELAAKLSK